MLMGGRGEEGLAIEEGEDWLVVLKLVLRKWKAHRFLLVGWHEKWRRPGIVGGSDYNYEMQRQ